MPRPSPFHLQFPGCPSGQCLLCFGLGWLYKAPHTPLILTTKLLTHFIPVCVCVHGTHMCEPRRYIYISLNFYDVVTKPYCFQFQLPASVMERTCDEAPFPFYTLLILQWARTWNLGFFTFPTTSPRFSNKQHSRRHLPAMKFKLLSSISNFSQHLTQVTYCGRDSTRVKTTTQICAFLSQEAAF